MHADSANLVSIAPFGNTNNEYAQIFANLDGGVNQVNYQVPTTGPVHTCSCLLQVKNRIPVLPEHNNKYTMTLLIVASSAYSCLCQQPAEMRDSCHIRNICLMFTSQGAVGGGPTFHHVHVGI